MTATPERVALAGAEADHYRAAFPSGEADRLFAVLRRELDWREATIRLFGRAVTQPRLSAWYGDAPYTYSNLTWPARPWPDPLPAIKARVEALAGQSFNGVLANLYRDGRDSMGWHADDEPELGPDPVVASVVFGTARRFLFKRKDDAHRKLEVALGHGDILVMGPGTQRHWLHAVPKTAKPVGERINLTFRLITAS